MRVTKPPSQRPDPADAGLAREQRRLRHVITALLAAIAPAAAIQACGDAGSGEVTPGPDAGNTQETGAETGAQVEASTDAPADADAGAEDAPIKNCTMKITTFDSGADAEPGCIYQLPCGLSQGLFAIGCELYSAPEEPINCTMEEGYGCEADAYAPGPDGEVRVVCPHCLGGGRRPAGLVPPRESGARTAAGAYFARMAHDEAAAVHAFVKMRDELADHGAPAALVRAAERSARDEVRHARLMGRRARAMGAAIPRVRVRKSAPRSLEAIARENAVEGCVNETFGALLLAWQAAHARDASARATFARIAADETRHAALSWAVARWIEPRIDPRARARVAAARSRAIHALRRCIPASPFDLEVGRPSPSAHAALVEGMIRGLGLDLRT